MSRVIDKSCLLQHLPLKVNVDNILVFTSDKEVVEDMEKKPIEKPSEKPSEKKPNEQNLENLMEISIADALNSLSNQLDETKRVLDALLQSSNRIGDLIESFVKPVSAPKSLIKL